MLFEPFARSASRGRTEAEPASWDNTTLPRFWFAAFLGDHLFGAFCVHYESDRNDKDVKRRRKVKGRSPIE